MIALGGGALLDVRNRSAVEEAGQVMLLNASPDVLANRLQADATVRPLLHEKNSLTALLQQRTEHYASFLLQLDIGLAPLEDLAWQAQMGLGMFHISGMGVGYDVRVLSEALGRIGNFLQSALLMGPVVLVTDENIEALYAGPVSASIRDAGFKVFTVTVPSGESNKSMHSVNLLWDYFLDSQVERSSTIIALGGGVLTDLVGFAAATFLRGVQWVAIPTSLLAMVDASLGGKTGVDLPQGKNLVGAFYPPRLVISDPSVLTTLSEPELRSGMAEVLKHGVIHDPRLFAMCAQGLDRGSTDWSTLVKRAMAVKIRILGEDPYEQHRRAALNLGHTIGHTVELASGFTLRHGEAIAIGMVAEARLSEKLGLADRGLSRTISAALTKLELPTEIPTTMPADQLIDIMQKDKKRAAGVVRFALPIRIGEVITGVEVPDLAAVIG